MNRKDLGLLVLILAVGAVVAIRQPLFVAPNNPAGQRGPRIEVGTGLEPILTDALSSVIVNQEMMPRLRAGEVPQAMVAGADAVIAQLRAAPEEAQAKVDAAVKQFDSTQKSSRKRSGGRGFWPQAGSKASFWARNMST